MLKDKVCVVTGAAGSIGLASAAAMRNAGARVLLVDRHEDALTAAAATLGGIGPDVAVCTADVATTAGTQAYIEAACSRCNHIDVLFSNAGIGGVISPITEYPEDVFDAVMAVNVRASFLACKYGLPRMRAGGSIIITSSVVGVTSDPGICAYATSKHAVIGLMRTAAKEAARQQVRVNVVAPGPIDNSFQKTIEDGLSRAIGRDATKFLDGIIPLGRHGRAEEIASLVLFLASDQSSFTTGSVLMADGGMHI